jgi:hypothetical protein
VVDVVRRQTLDPEQMPVPERSLSGASVHEPETIGAEPRPGNNDCRDAGQSTTLRRGDGGITSRRTGKPLRDRGTSGARRCLSKGAANLFEMSLRSLMATSSWRGFLTCIARGDRLAQIGDFRALRDMLSELDQKGGRDPERRISFL